MNRVEDWPERLEVYVNKQRSKNFSWDTFHCLNFSDGAVKSVTGESYYKEFRAKYDTEKTDEELMEEIGAAGIFKILQSIFGKQIPVSMAQRGDLVVMKKPYSIGVCRGAVSNFIGDGITEVETLKAAYAFKVGR